MSWADSVIHRTGNLKARNVKMLTNLKAIKFYKISVPRLQRCKEDTRLVVDLTASNATQGMRNPL